MLERSGHRPRDGHVTSVPYTTLCIVLYSTSCNCLQCQAHPIFKISCLRVLQSTSRQAGRVCSSMYNSSTETTASHTSALTVRVADCSLAAAYHQSSPSYALLCIRSTIVHGRTHFDLAQRCWPMSPAARQNSAAILPRLFSCLISS